MTLPDAVNGSFELLGGLAQFVNCRRLLRDKKVSGVDWRVTAFFTAWGFWNLFYYPHLDQWLSFAGGIGIVVTNCVWVGLALHYGMTAADGLSDAEIADRFLGSETR